MARTLLITLACVILFAIACLLDWSQAQFVQVTYKDLGDQPITTLLPLGTDKVAFVWARDLYSADGTSNGTKRREQLPDGVVGGLPHEGTVHFTDGVAWKYFDSVEGKRRIVAQNPEDCKFLPQLSTRYATFGRLDFKPSYAQVPIPALRRVYMFYGHGLSERKDLGGAVTRSTNLCFLCPRTVRGQFLLIKTSVNLDQADF